METNGQHEAEVNNEQLEQQEPTDNQKKSEQATKKPKVYREIFRGGNHMGDL